MAEKKRSMPKAIRVILIVFTVFAAFIVTVVGGLSLLKYAIYADFYKTHKNEFAIPGLNDNGVPQGICYDENSKRYFVSEYDKRSGKPSRIYTIDEDGKSVKYCLYDNDEPFTGHVGGIAVGNGYLYITHEGGIYSVDLALFDGKDFSIDLVDYKPVNNAASYVFSDDTYLYVGEFHYSKVEEYTLHHDVETSEGTHHAIISRYNITDFDPKSNAIPVPNQIISVREKVQGFAKTSDNKYVLSTSWGVSSSHAYIYNEDKLVEQGTYTDEKGVTTPLYVLSNHDTDLLAPAMFEDLEYVNGRIVTLTESACDKYIFGKFFGAYYAFSFKV